MAAQWRPGSESVAILPPHSSSFLVPFGRRVLIFEFRSLSLGRGDQGGRGALSLFGGR